MGLKALQKLAIDLSDKLIHKFGGDCIIQIITKTSQGGLIAQNTFETITKQIDCVPPVLASVNQVGMTQSVQSGDYVTFLRASELDSLNLIQGYITYNNIRYKIINYNKISGGNEVAMIELYCRGIH